MINMNKLLYLGHASIRIITEGKVIYIDPFCGDYSMSADLVLVTHSHYDHNDLSKVENRNNDCKIIKYSDALVNGEYKSFDLGFVKVDGVPAGYNKNHNENECVGYLLTLNNGIKIYIAGDTSTTPYMEELGHMNIDYAFYPCDGIYNMDVNEASTCANIVNAKHSIPYHTKPGEAFDIEIANKFTGVNKMIIKPFEEIDL